MKAVILGGKWTLILVSMALAIGCAGTPQTRPQAVAEVVSENPPTDDIRTPNLQYQLGLHFFFGMNVQQDYGKALHWFTKAARQGYVDAQNNLGAMYAQGLGIRKDWNEALKWLSKAAKKGSADAQQNLGLMYSSGTGVEKDYSKALMWFRLAAAHGHSGAQAQLGGLYARGNGVWQDYDKALLWFRKAAGQGDPYAQYHLGIMYQEGRGLPADEVQAYKWILLSASGKNKESSHAKNPLTVDIQNAKYLLEKQLSPTQQVKAREMVRQWRPDHATASPSKPAKTYQSEFSNT